MQKIDRFIVMTNRRIFPDSRVRMVWNTLDNMTHLVTRNGPAAL